MGPTADKERTAMERERMERRMVRGEGGGGVVEGGEVEVMMGWVDGASSKVRERGESAVSEPDQSGSTRSSSSSSSSVSSASGRL